MTRSVAFVAGREVYALCWKIRATTQQEKSGTGNLVGQNGFWLKTLRTFAFLLAGTLAIAAPISAAPILDQVQLATTQENQGFHSIRSVGQTWTAGVTGTLDSIELSIRPFGSGADVTIEILDNSGGDLSLAPVLGSLNVPESALGPWPINLVAASITGTLIDLSSLAIDINSGDALAMRLSSARVLSNGDLYAAATSNTNPYASGSFFLDNVIDGARDFAFKTFVVVPEPSTGLLLGIAGLTVLCLRRRRVAR